MAAQDYEQVTYNSPGGAQIGQSATEKVGFYGATPVAQVASASQAAAVTSPSAAYVQAEAVAVFTLVNQLRADLVTLGLIKGSA